MASFDRDKLYQKLLQSAKAASPQVTYSTIQKQVNFSWKDAKSRLGKSSVAFQQHIKDLISKNNVKVSKNTFDMKSYFVGKTQVFILNFHTYA